MTDKQWRELVREFRDLVGAVQQLEDRVDKVESIAIDWDANNIRIPKQPPHDPA